MSVFLVLCLLCLWIPSAAAESSKSVTPCFELVSASGQVGDVVEIQLKIQNNPGITALRLELTYTRCCLELVGIEDTGLLPGGISTGAIESNPAYLSWHAPDSLDHTASGTLAILRFRIKAASDEAAVTVSYDEEDVFNCQLKNVSFAICSANVNISSAEEPQPPCFVLSEAAGETGDVAEVNFEIQNNPGITSLRVRIGYPADRLELLSIEDRGLFPDGIITGQMSKNPITVSWHSVDSTDNHSSGQLAVLRFQIKGGAADKECEITLSYSEEDVFNSRFENTWFDTVQGTVIAKRVDLLGDVDGDGKVTILDATCVQRYLAGYHVLSADRVERCGYFSGDGVDILSATYIQRYLAGFQVPYPIGIKMNE